MGDKPEKVIPEKCIGAVVQNLERFFNKKECITYALAIGCSQDPMNENDFKFTYENNEDFVAFPCMPAIFSAIIQDGEKGSIQDCPGLPQFNPMGALHGEQKITILKNITPGIGKLTSKNTILDVADKRSGAVVTTGGDIVDSKGTVYSKFESKVFIKGLGGFGGKSLMQNEIPAVPTTPPTATRQLKTNPNQALLYRLAGDFNPLHADPNMAAMGGFDKPIIHGLCSYGIIAKLVYDQYCGNDPNNFKEMNARFTSHVFPGETYVVDMWKQGEQIIFAAKTLERQKVTVVGYVKVGAQAKL